MNILLVAATEPELAQVQASLETYRLMDKHWGLGYGLGHELTLLHTGVGLVNTAIRLTELLIDRTFDYVIHLGIAGSFYPERYPIGSVVEIQTEIYVGLGAEDGNGNILGLEQLGFGNFQVEEQLYYNVLQNPSVSDALVPKVIGGSVQLVTGEQESVHKWMKRYPIEIETMESAALFQVCLMYKQPFLSFRGISNVVEKRDKSKWNIPLALSVVQSYVLSFLREEDNFKTVSNFRYQ